MTHFLRFIGKVQAERLRETCLNPMDYEEYLHTLQLGPYPLSIYATGVPALDDPGFCHACVAFAMNTFVPENESADLTAERSEKARGWTASYVLFPTDVTMEAGAAVPAPATCVTYDWARPYHWDVPLRRDALSTFVSQLEQNVIFPLDRAGKNSSFPIHELAKASLSLADAEDCLSGPEGRGNSRWLDLHEQYRTGLSVSLQQAGMRMMVRTIQKRKQ